MGAGVGALPPSVRNTIGGLVDRACSETGLDDLGDDTWREGLERLVRSAETEGCFNDFGRDSFYASIVRSLSNRLQIEMWYTRHPDIDDQEVEIDLLGVGFPRTGSTALSAMLGEDAGYRHLRTWEESAPCPPPGVSAEADQSRIEASQAGIDLGHSYMAERLRSMIPQSATGPMEDHDLMALEFKAQSFLVSAHVPSYAEWFATCDMVPTYRYEKRVLKLLQWKTPEKRWRLKSPTHTMFLDAYLEVFPGARFVQTHRDISKVLPSVSDLYFTLLEVGNPGIEPVYVGHLNIDQWGTALQRCLAFREDPANDARFYDIGFDSFQMDPAAEIEKLYRWLRSDLTDQTRQRMAAWRQQNPKDKFGRHSYDGRRFGLTEEALEQQFGSYRSRFGSYLTRTTPE